jgi:hypothetical protein
MLVKFLINPTGQFNLSYNLGEVVDIETKQAELLLEAGAVEVVAAAKTKKKPTNPETELDAE